MDTERPYRAALTLTQQMLSAATALNWGLLAQLQAQRAKLLASTQPLDTLTRPPAQMARLAEIISEMERDNTELLDVAQTCQEHIKILLRLDKYPVASAT